MVDMYGSHNSSMDFGYNISLLEEYNLYRRYATSLYYLVLLPVAFIGNILTVVVVGCIVKHQRTRRSIPDICIGSLACVDLLSVVLIHSVTVTAHSNGASLLPHGMCGYQAFMCSIYVKMQFMLQVMISIDRHFALVRPLTYHRISSLHATKVILVTLLLAAILSSTFTLLMDKSHSVVLPTWPMCLYTWHVTSLADYIIATIYAAVFIAGFIAFIVCNVTLVKILFHYHTTRAKMVFQGINEAVNAMNRGPQLPFTSPKPPDVIKTPVPQHGHQNSNPKSMGCTNNEGEQSMAGSVTSQVWKVESRPTCVDNQYSNVGYHRQTSLPAEVNFSSNNAADRSAVSDSILPQLEKHKTNSTCPPTQYGTNQPATQLSAHSTGLNGLIGNVSMQTGLNSQVSPTNMGAVEIVISDADTQNNKDHSPNTDSSYVNDDNPQSSKSFTTSSSPIPAIVIEAASCHSLDANPESPAKQQHQLLSILSKPKTKMKKSVSFQDTPLHRHSLICNIPSSKSDHCIKKRHSVVSWHSSTTGSQKATSSSSRSSQRSSGSRVQIQRPPSRNHLAMRRNVSPSPIVIEPEASPAPYTPVCYDEPVHLQFQHFQDQVRKVLRKLQRKADKQKKEILLAKLVVLCASLFVLTWLPYVVVTALSLAGVQTSPIIHDLAVKLIFSNAVVNPMFYGLCRRNYRKGYDYVTQAFCHYVSLGCVDKPGEEKVFYESRRRKQKQHIAMGDAMEAHRMANQRHIRRASTMQVLQQTLAMRAARSPGALLTPQPSQTETPPTPQTAPAETSPPCTPIVHWSPSSPFWNQSLLHPGTPNNLSVSQTGHSLSTPHTPQLLSAPDTARSLSTSTTPSFMPSRRLQQLFERYIDESSESCESSTSSIDYDALLFDGEEELVDNLRRVWSMYLPDPPSEEDDDVQIDVDYDALADGEGIPLKTLAPPGENGKARSSSYCTADGGQESFSLMSRLARSTPNFLRQLSSVSNRSKS